MFCEKCGGVLEENASFCRFCGNKIESEANTEEGTNAKSIDTPPEINTDAQISPNGNNKSASKAKYITLIISLVAVITIVGVLIAISVHKENDTPRTAEDKSYSENVTDRNVADAHTQKADDTKATEPTLKTTPVLSAAEKLVLADGGLRIRTQPSIDTGERIGVIPNGSRIVVDKIVDGWAYTTYNGVSGWCSAEFLFDPADYDGKALFTANVNAYEGLRLRSEPNTDSDNIVTVAPFHAAVQVYKVEGEWAYIAYNNIFGWSSTEYLEKS